jgi:putative SOS response-associated peptidase YedK
MLTMPPRPDVAPYHDRQITILEREQWAAWLDVSVPSRLLLKALPEGSLAVKQVG